MKAVNRKKMLLILSGAIVVFTIIILYANFKPSQSPWSAKKGKATNLMEDISPNKTVGLEADELFIDNISDFSIKFFQTTYPGSGNILVSPASAMFALSMAANGANGDTLTEMNRVLSKDIPLDDLNRYLYSFRKNLKNTKKSKIQISNSVWFRDDFTVENNFLQTLSDYYDVSVYQAPFNNQTLDDINNWIKNCTNGEIDRALNQIEKDDMMYLINALTFDAKWKDKYEKDDVRDNSFYNQDGSSTTVKFMSSTESYYLDDGKATGFIKPYYDDNYRFVALLPNEDISISDYVNQLTGESFINTLNTAIETKVSVKIPEFHSESSLSLREVLQTLGMENATSFDADFTKIDKSTLGELLYLKDMIQKTYITVDPKGTKAGGVSIVLFGAKSGDDFPYKSVILDKPFVYAIIDSKTNIPVFLGVLSHIRNTDY